MQELQYRIDIEITDANKGGVVVILDEEVYVTEAERQLNNKENYRKANCAPATANNETINKVILIFQKENLLMIIYLMELKQKTLRHRVFT